MRFNQAALRAPHPHDYLSTIFSSIERFSSQIKTTTSLDSALREDQEASLETLLCRSFLRRGRNQ